MPDNENTPHPPAGGLLWVGAALALVITALAAGSYGASNEIDAAPGSPLYGKAVHEAIQGLAGNRAKQHAAGQPGAARPPLPAGLSPNDYYWCDKCKAYHKHKPGGAGQASPPAAAGQPAAAQPAPPANPQPVAGQPAAARPPLPAGFSPDEVYWCEKCKAYHKRNPKSPQQPAARPPAPEATPAE